VIYFPDTAVALLLHRAILNPSSIGVVQEEPEASQSFISPEGMGRLDSALHSIQHAYHYEGTGVIVLAGMLAVRVALNHPFPDGNKRAAVALMLYFLSQNGYELPAERQMDLFEPLINVIEKEVTEQHFCEVLAGLVRPKRPPDRSA
jgi:death-on-curing family protein